MEIERACSGGEKRKEEATAAMADSVSSNTGTCFVSSQCLVYTGGLVWDIERFLLFNTPGKSYSSLEFRAGDTRWKLNCFAAGELSDTNEPSNFLGLYLHSLNDKNLQCKYSVTLFIGDQKIEEIADCDEFGKNDNWGWGQLCPIDVLQHIMQECTTLRIKCEVEVFVKRHNIATNGRAVGENPALPTECTSNTISKHYQQMLETVPYSDMVFICKGQRIPAHRSILSIRSPVFHRMFASGMSESKDGIVTIEDCDISIFQELLKFLYTGSLKPDILAKNVQDLMVLSDKYDLEDLRVLCDTTFLQQLSAQNAASILHVADTYHSLKLKAEVMSFAVTNFEAVITSKGFVELCEGNPSLVAEFNLAHANHVKETIRPTKKKKT